MAVKASAHITLSYMIDVKATYRYYLLQSATLSTPSKPTTYPPASTWDDTEPSYTEGSTNRLYFVDCTVFTDDKFAYSEVSLSSSYEAAKAAYNKAVNAQNMANSAQESVDNLKVGGRNLISGTSFDAEYSGVMASGSSYKDVWSGVTIDIPTETEYVVSFDAKADADMTIRCYFYSPNTTLTSESSTGQTSTGADGVASVSVTTEWRRYWVKWTQTAATAIKRVLVGRMTDSTNYLYIRAVKLEVGHIPSAWSPAPEDVDEAVENAQKTADSAQNDVDNTKVYTHVATSVDGGDTLTYFDFSGHVESGTLSNGAETANASYIRLTEYVKVIPGNSYVWNVKNSSGKEVKPVTHFYSESSGSYTYLSSQKLEDDDNNIITVPSGTSVYLRSTANISYDEADDITYELTLSNLNSIIESLTVNVYVGIYTTLKSFMSIDPDDYVWELTDTSTLKNATELAESLNTQLNGTDGTNGVIASLHTGINEVNKDVDKLDGKIGKINSFIVIDDDAPSITLVSTGDIQNPGNKILITDDKISFYSGATEGAYIGYPDDDATDRTAMMASKTYVTEMYPRVEGTEDNKWVGSLCWIARTNGHLSLKVVK